MTEKNKKNKHLQCPTVAPFCGPLRCCSAEYTDGLSQRGTAVMNSPRGRLSVLAHICVRLCLKVTLPLITQPPPLRPLLLLLHHVRWMEGVRGLSEAINNLQYADVNNLVLCIAQEETVSSADLCSNTPKSTHVHSCTQSCAQAAVLAHNSDIQSCVDIKEVMFIENWSPIKAILWWYSVTSSLYMRVKYL